jgi:hypothetical protein
LLRKQGSRKGGGGAPDEPASFVPELLCLSSPHLLASSDNETRNDLFLPRRLSSRGAAEAAAPGREFSCCGSKAAGEEEEHGATAGLLSSHGRRAANEGPSACSACEAAGICLCIHGLTPLISSRIPVDRFRLRSAPQLLCLQLFDGRFHLRGRHEISCVVTDSLGFHRLHALLRHWALPIC